LHNLERAPGVSENSSLFAKCVQNGRGSDLKKATRLALTRGNAKSLKIGRLKSGNIKTPSLRKMCRLRFSRKERIVVFVKARTH